MNRFYSGKQSKQTKKSGPHDAKCPVTQKVHFMSLGELLGITLLSGRWREKPVLQAFPVVLELGPLFDLPLLVLINILIAFPLMK